MDNWPSLSDRLQASLSFWKPSTTRRYTFHTEYIDVDDCFALLHCFLALCPVAHGTNNTKNAQDRDHTTRDLDEERTKSGDDIRTHNAISVREAACNDDASQVSRSTSDVVSCPARAKKKVCRTLTLIPAWILRNSATLCAPVHFPRLTLLQHSALHRRWCEPAYS
jgi:hypothetical protein